MMNTYDILCRRIVYGRLTISALDAEAAVEAAWRILDNNPPATEKYFSVERHSDHIDEVDPYISNKETKV